METVEEPGVTWQRPRHCGDGVRVTQGAIHGLGHVWPGGLRLLPAAVTGPVHSAVRATPLLLKFFREAVGR